VFRQHTNKDILDVAGFSSCLGDVSVTRPRTQVTVSEGPLVALEICQLDGDDRPLDAHVLVRRGLRLGTDTESARALEELGFARTPGGDDS
jgi:hypothetical protein